MFIAEFISTVNIYGQLAHLTFYGKTQLQFLETKLEIKMTLFVLRFKTINATNQIEVG